MNMKQSAIFLAMFAIIGLTVPPAGAAKKKAFKTGTYKATGGVSFEFRVQKNQCHNELLQIKRGYCFNSDSNGGWVNMDCPDPYVDDTTRFFVPSNIVIPRSGKINFKSDESDDSRDALVFKMTLKTNGRATGSVSLTSLLHPRGCTSGKLSFSAKRVGK